MERDLNKLFIDDIVHCVKRTSGHIFTSQIIERGNLEGEATVRNVTPLASFSLKPQVAAISF